MRILGRILVVLLIVLFIAGGGVLWLLKDPNRFKPQLEALAQEATGYELSLDGDLSWQLWPPVVLKGETIRFSDESTDYELRAFGVRANLLPLLRGGELEVTQLRVDDLLMVDREFGDRTRVDSLRIEQYQAGVAGPLVAAITLESDDAPPVKLNVEGPFTYFPDEDRLTLAPMQFTYDGIDGSCDVAASQLSREPMLVSKPTADDLLPLDTVRAMDWQVACTVPEFASGDQRLRNIKLESRNTAARMANKVVLPDALGGSVTTTVDIDARQRPPLWNIKSDATEIQSQALMDLLAPSLRWVAPLLAGGQFKLQGNTIAALAESADGQVSFESNAGQIDIGALKDTVLGLARLAGKGEQVERWARDLQYTKLTGDWKVQGKQQDIRVAIDNLALAAKGSIDALSGAMDLRGTVTVEEDATLDILKVSDELYGLPIPLRCSGSLEEPSCGLDTEAAQGALADYAAGRARGEVSERINEALEEKVPEEYRDAAKGLLKGLFGNQEDREE